MARGPKWAVAIAASRTSSGAWQKLTRCVASVATHPFDLVIEGSAERVTDTDELRSVAEQYVRQGWPTQVEGDALTAEYSAPSAGPPPWQLYKITPSTVFAFGTAEPYGATRFDLTR